MKLNKKMVSGALALALAFGGILTAEASSKKVIKSTDKYEVYTEQIDGILYGKVEGKNGTKIRNRKFEVKPKDSNIVVEKLNNTTFRFYVDSEGVKEKNFDEKKQEVLDGMKKDGFDESNIKLVEESENEEDLKTNYEKAYNLELESRKNVVKEKIKENKDLKDDEKENLISKLDEADKIEDVESVLDNKDNENGDKQDSEKDNDKDTENEKDKDKEKDSDQEKDKETNKNVTPNVNNNSTKGGQEEKTPNQDQVKKASANPKTGVVSEGLVAIAIITASGGLVFSKKGKESKAALALALSILAGAGGISTVSAQDIDLQVIKEAFGPTEITVLAYDKNTKEYTEVELEVLGSVEFESSEGTTEDPVTDDLDSYKNNAVETLKTFTLIDSGLRDYYISSVVEDAEEKFVVDIIVAEAKEENENAKVLIEKRKEYIAKINANEKASKTLKDKYIGLFESLGNVHAVEDLYNEFLEKVEQENQKLPESHEDPKEEVDVQPPSLNDVPDIPNDKILD